MNDQNSNCPCPEANIFSLKGICLEGVKLAVESDNLVNKNDLDEVLSAVARIRETAEAAKIAAEEAHNTAQNAQATADRAMGVYTLVSLDELDADRYSTNPEKLYLTGNDLLNFPVTAPLYFDVHVNDDGTSVTQMVRTDASGQVAFSRSGARDAETGEVFWRSGWQGAVPLVPGSGLEYAPNGRLGFDPTGWSDEISEEVTRRIRVPFWLVANISFHVDAAGGLDVPERDGKTPEQSWKTIQYALNHIATNYNLDRHNLTLMVAAGVYNEDITLPYYNRTTGVINIVGDNVTLQGAIALAGQGVGRYNLRGFSIEFAGRPSPGSVGWYGIFALEGTSMVLSDVTIDMKNESTGILKSCIRSQGSVSINQNCVFKGNGARFWYSEGGKIYLNRDCLCEGTVSLGTVGVSSLGIFGVTTTANGGVRPVISGTVTGKRYAVSGFSVISTASGGKEYFPGTLPGSNENGVYDGIFEKP